MHSCENITAQPQTSLREVMAIIDRGRLEISLVVDREGQLKGTVTDGDIRRAILRGLSLETPVINVMKHHFTAVGLEATEEEVLRLMRSRSIKQIPVLTPDGQLLGLHVLLDLLGQPDER